MGVLKGAAQLRKAAIEPARVGRPPGWGEADEKLGRVIHHRFLSRSVSPAGASAQPCARTGVVAAAAAAATAAAATQG